MRVPRGLIAVVVLGVLLWMVWSRLRIVVFIPITGWQAFLYFTLVAGGIFLAIDHWLNGSGRNKS